MVEETRPHELGADGGDVDVDIAEFGVEGAGEIEDEALGAAVDGKARLRGEGGHGRRVEDTRTRRHVGENPVRELNGCAHEDVDHAARGVTVLEGEIPGGAKARVVYEEPHARAGGLGERTLEEVVRAGVGEVEAEGANGRPARANEGG